MQQTMTATPNHAIIAAYSPRTEGPTARATMMPPTPAVRVVATLNPAVRATLRPIPGRLNVVASSCSRVGAACEVKVSLEPGSTFPHDERENRYSTIAAWRSSILDICDEMRQDVSLDRNQKGRQSLSMQGGARKRFY